MKPRHQQFAKDTLDLLKRAQGGTRPFFSGMNVRTLSASKKPSLTTSTGFQSRGFFSLNRCYSNARMLPTAACQHQAKSSLVTPNVAQRGFARGSRNGDNDKDYYSMLGLDKNASPSDIKKNYFNLAKKYHPDVNPSGEAKEKFAKINNAYETLSDEGKRRVYDQTGMTGDEQAQDPFGGQNPFGGGGNPFAGGQGFAGFEGFSEQFGRAQGGRGGGGGGFGDIFEEFEKMFGGEQGARRAEAQTKGQDIVVNVEIEFMDAVNGAQKVINFGRTDVCNTCKGTKSKPGTSASTCGGCGGQGFQTIRQGPFMIQQVCGNCDGVGKIIRNPCMTCRGKGTTHGSTKETINIPKGVDNGVNLRVAKKGHAGQAGPHGDLIIHVKVRNHSYFKREGSNIHTDLYLNISQAVLGADLAVKTLYGNVTIKIPPGTGHEERKKISNYGIQKLPPNHHQKGNHYVTIKLVIPKKLSPEQREAMEAYAKTEPELNK